MGKSIMNIAITGATGFIGGFLSTQLEKQGHKVTPIRRDLLRKESRDKLEKSDAVINLAGYPIRCRWTPTHQKLILKSRVSVTKTIVKTINGLVRKPSILISSSAVGIYPSSNTTPWDESTLRQGTGCLAHVCQAWEEEAGNLSPETRRVITRFGVVLAPSGGAFPSMIQPLKFGVSAIIGKGDHPLAWISRTDLAALWNLFCSQTPSEASSISPPLLVPPITASRVKQPCALGHGSPCISHHGYSSSPWVNLLVSS